MSGKRDSAFSHELSIRRRSIILALFLLALVGGLALRLVQLQTLEHSRYAGIARSQHWGENRIPAERGSLYVRDLASGSTFPVAISDERTLIYAVPAQIKDHEAAARRLAGPLQTSPAEIIKAFDRSSSYAVLKRRADSSMVTQVKDLKIAGVAYTPEHVRIYPEGRLASSVIGFVNPDLIGQYGLERAFQDQLAGEDGYQTGEKDSNGIPIAGGHTLRKAPVDGARVTLTIDRNIQQAAEAALKANVEKYRADSGSVAMMDPSSGQILAMASWPDYDPNRYGEVTDYTAFTNQSVDAAYEPGSVFKVITMAAGIDTGKFSPETKFNDTGQVTVSGHTIKNADKKAHGEVTMSYVLARSLNVGTVYALSQFGADVFYRYIDKFGFGTGTGIEFEGESAGSVQKQKGASALDVAAMTFGQGITVTPLQMLVAVGSVANKGQMVQPHIVENIQSSDGTRETPGTRVVRQTVSEEAAKSLTTMMEMVVTDGWGKPAAVPGYRVAGKTGTAQIPRKDGKGYEDSATIGTFVGFAPAEDPKFVMITRLDRPKGVGFSEEPAAWLWKDIAKFTLDYFQVPPKAAS